ncbi:Os11g0312160 [Oryza sativa Japonica Group]|uniref:Os11g0312160 protein n=1 Tax=Oryza sativa subsp. japonica TaxID=39947 RepID=A0A0N7KST8_ORYSJ|nr:Os11g0312160 [Oryza sativa Japonica Group]
MGRRLTLVPGAMTWLSAGVSDVLEVSDEEGDQEGRRQSSSPGSIQVGMKGKVARSFSAPSKGFREEFSGAAKPKTFGSRFWALGDVSDATDSESKGEKDAATSVEEAFPEARFVRRALAEGFTVDEVLKASEHLLLNPAATSGSCTKSTNLKGNGLLARRIVDSVAKRKESSIKPRKGPLPRARISQPLTIGDKLDEAFTAKLSNSVKFRKAWVPIATRQENEATLSRERDESCAGLREEDDKEVFLATEEERRELIFGSTTGRLET